MNDVLASNVPGRIRLRGQQLRQPHVLDCATRLLEAIPGVVEVQSNQRVGSLLLRYDPLRLPQSTALERLEAVLARLLPLNAEAARSARQQPEGGAEARSGVASCSTLPGMAAEARARQGGEKPDVLGAHQRTEPVADSETAWMPAWQRAYPPSTPGGAVGAAAHGGRVSTVQPRTANVRTQRASRTERVVRAERAERTDRTDRTDRTERTDRSGSAASRVSSALAAVGKAAASVLPALKKESESGAVALPERRGPSKGQWKRYANRYAKRGMMLSLGSSLGLAAAGAKGGHIVTGSAFVAALGVHLFVHRKSLMK